MKNFNVTGVCVHDKHYMVDISKKFEQIIKLIESEDYFTINRARQYGKTTTLNHIFNQLKDKYIVLSTSFEGVGDDIFSSERIFCENIIKIFARDLKFNYMEEGERLEKLGANLSSLSDVSEAITNFVKNEKKEVILIIDEVDKSSNNQLFLSFLGVLRDKYLKRQQKRDFTFKSVILAGVYDIKNLKLKLREDEKKQYNSPWNIAADFDVDMSFNSDEIATMLFDYENENGTGMDIKDISAEIYRYTNGYPFLVSKISKIIDEKMGRNWNSARVEEAVKLLLDEKNTLFDDLIKNLENNKALYELVYDILVEGKKITFNIHAPIIELGVILGILEKRETYISVTNKIFELCIYNYMISKRSLEKGELVTYEYRSKFVIDGKLDMELVLNKFQEVMCDEFRDKDAKFIEREGRLLFLCFLKPIINGKGFYYVEAETRMDNRMDIVVTYGGEQHIVELKIWHGENYESEALEQLSGYLESKREKRGYLISFSFNKNKQYSKEWKKQGEKTIYAIVV